MALLIAVWRDGRNELKLQPNTDLTIIATAKVVRSVHNEGRVLRAD